MNFELAQEIINQVNNDGTMKASNRSAMLKSAGVGKVTNRIEQISETDLITDAQPGLGKNDKVWVLFSLTTIAIAFKGE